MTKPHFTIEAVHTAVAGTNIAAFQPRFQRFGAMF
jgi:hypothetical protein